MTIVGFGEHIFTQVRVRAKGYGEGSGSPRLSSPVTSRASLPTPTPTLTPTPTPTPGPPGYGEFGYTPADPPETAQEIRLRVRGQMPTHQPGGSGLGVRCPRTSQVARA